MKKIVLMLCVALPIAANSGAAVEQVNNERTGAQEMANKGAFEITNKGAWTLYEKYLEGWNSTSDDIRKKVAAEVTADNFQYRTRNHELGGRPELVADMASFQSRFPGGHFEIGDVSSHHNVALLTWVIIQADGKEFARGGDQITVDRNGRISSIITFPPATKTP
jgi:hypothetical protein